jgi:hypothetical protein
MMSILLPSNAFLVLTRFATFLLRVRITSYINTQLEGVDSAGGRNAYGGKTATGVRLLQRCEWLQQPDHLRYIKVAAFQP